MEQCKVKHMYDLNETIAAGLLEGVEYPWEALKGISDFIRSLGPSLDPDRFEQRGEKRKHSQKRFFKRAVNY